MHVNRIPLHVVISPIALFYHSDMTKHEIAPRRPQLESDWGENRAHVYVRSAEFYFSVKMQYCRLKFYFFVKSIFEKKKNFIFFVKSNQIFFFQIRPQPQATELSL